MAIGVVLLVLLGVVWMLSDRVELKPEDCLRRVRRAPAVSFATVVNQGPGRVVLEYDDETTLNVSVRPRRIVSTLPGITETLAHLGALRRVVAVSPHCDTPEQVAQLPTLTVLPLDVERLVSLEPDLVILDRRLHRPAIAQVRQRVPSVLLLDTSHSLAHLSTSIELLARVLDDETARERARAWTQSLTALEASIANRHHARAPRVLIVAQWEPLYVVGPGGLLDDLVRACGCINVACDLLAGASGTFSEELVFVRRPDWVLSTTGDIPDDLATRWARVPAVFRDQMLDVSSDAMVRGGPRIPESLEVLAQDLLDDVPR